MTSNKTEFGRILAVLALIAAFSTAAWADAVTDWNEQTVLRASTGGRPGPTWVLDVAVDADLHRFVFCSTIGTIAIGDGHTPATEDMPFDWHGKGGAYIESRCAAEDLVLRYVRESGLPAVVMNVSNPYGPRDWQPSQGMMVQMAALGKLPAYIKDVSTEVVGIEDVADAFLLAGERGRIGERYIISETFMPMREMLETAASAVGHSHSSAPTVKPRVTRNWVRKKLGLARGLRFGLGLAVFAGESSSRHAVMPRASRKQKSASMVHRPP